MKDTGARQFRQPLLYPGIKGSFYIQGREAGKGSETIQKPETH